MEKKKEEVRRARMLAQAKAEPRHAWVTETLSTFEGAATSSTKIAEVLKINRHNVLRRLTALEAAGLVERSGSGWLTFWQPTAKAPCI